MTSLLATPTFIAALVAMMTALATLITALATRLTANDTNAKVTETHSSMLTAAATNNAAHTLMNGTAAAIQQRIDTIELAIREVRELGLTPLTVPLPPPAPPALPEQVPEPK